MIPILHLKDEVETVNVQLTIMGTLQVYTNDQELQQLEIYQLNEGKCDTNLPCSPQVSNLYVLQKR